MQLSEVLRQIQRAEPVDAGRVYRLLGVRWYGQGLFVRDEKIGADIAADRIYGVKPGDFLYNRLFAWKGSFAVAGAEASGTYVSNEFPRFAAHAARLDPHFLFWFFRQERIWSEVLGRSIGATPTSRNRASIRSALSRVRTRSPQKTGDVRRVAVPLRRNAGTPGPPDDGERCAPSPLRLSPEGFDPRDEPRVRLEEVETFELDSDRGPFVDTPA